MSNTRNSEDEAYAVRRRLLEKGIDTKRVNAAGETALIKATKKRDSKRVKQILEYNTDSINMPDNDGNTPLMIALSIGDYTTANILLDYEANVHLVNKKGEDAFMCDENHGPKPSSTSDIEYSQGTSRWGKCQGALSLTSSKSKK